MDNKVKYGLCNVHAFPITKDDGTETTYGEAIKIPGAVSLSLKAEGSSDPFYADNIAYYVSSSNNGYTGTLEIALMPDDFLIKILGQTKDAASGLLVESADDKNTAFALAFQFEGDEKATRHIFYNCKATRPSIEGETKADKTEPKTDSLDFTAVPRASDHHIKARCVSGDAKYEAFFTAPVKVGAN